jgi:ubiquinone/menaquinone biosynthesis C-methylase UbiE
MAEDNASIDDNRISPIYDTSRVANTETLEKLISLLHIGSDSVILDMGCGTGNYTDALRRVVKSVIGIDLSTGMLEQARVKFSDLLLICGDVTSMPFGPETFDAAFAVQVLHHMKEKELFLTEAYRALRNGAWIAIHACSHRQMRAFWFYHYFPKGLEVDLARMPDSGEIMSLLAKVGFSNIGIEICYRDVVVADETPQRYLDKNYRDSISTFAFLSKEDVELGCEKIQKDIASGEVESIVQQSEAKVANETGGSSIIYGRKADFWL